MDNLKKLLLGLAALAALAMGGSALAGATSSGGNDNAAQERSEAAEGPEQGDENEAAGGDSSLSAGLKARLEELALAQTGGDRVGPMERDGENGATYEVEVVKADGSQVDVRFDDQLKVVAVEGDHEDDQTGEHEGND